MNNLSFESILNEAYIPWNRFASILRRAVTSVTVEEPLIREFENLSKKLGGSIFNFDPITKTIKVIDWTKMSKSEIETILRSSNVRNIFIETLKQNSIDITDEAVRSTLTGVYKTLSDSYFNTANKVVKRDGNVVKEFIKGLKLSVTDFSIIRKIFNNVHLKYLKQYDEIEREVIKLTNEIVKKKSNPMGPTIEFDKLNRLFEQLVSLQGAEHQILWKELKPKLPKDFVNNIGKNGWQSPKFREFVKYFEGELPKPPKLIFDKIDAAKKLNPFKKDFYSVKTYERIFNTLIQWDPRTIDEMKQTIRVYGGAKFVGKTIGDKIIFGLVVYPGIIAFLKSLLDAAENATGLDIPIAKGEEFKKFEVFGIKLDFKSNILTNILNFVPNVVNNYVDSFKLSADNLRTIPGWSPLLALINLKDLTEKSNEEKKVIIKNTLTNMENQKGQLIDSVKKDVEGTQIIEKLKENIPNINLDSLSSSLGNTPPKKSKFDPNF
jgi:hypothetical protein